MAPDKARSAHTAGMINSRLQLFSTWAATLLLAGAVYAAGLSGYWVFDDFHNIVLNDEMTGQVWDKAHLVSLFASSNAGIFHRPLSVLSFYLDSYWFGLSPYAFKLTNVLIHLAAGLCLAGMGRALLELYRLKHAPGLTPSRINWLVLAATAIWLVHPINLTAVLYAVQRETSLAALFTALAVWAYLWARLRQEQSKPAAWIIWGLVPALTLVGIACKENAVLVPVFLLVVEISVLDFSLPDGRRNRQVLAFFALTFALPALLIVFFLLRGSPMLVGGYTNFDFTLGQRLLTECRVMFTYLQWIFLPDLKQLGLYHDDFSYSRGLLEPLTTLFAVIGIAGLFAAAAGLRRCRPLLCFAILWFLAGHLLESTVLPLELVFEHRNYLPLYGLVLGITVTVAETDVFKQHTRLLVFACVLTVLVLAGLTTLRAKEWRSPLAFAVYEAGHHPGSSRAQYEVGAILVAMTMSGQPELADSAAAAMLKARELSPNSISEDISLAVMYMQLGQEEKSSAYLQHATSRAGHMLLNPEVQSSMQAAITLSGDRRPLPFHDLDQLFRALLQNPNTAEAPCYTGNLLNSYALFLEDNAYIPEAMAKLHTALMLCPSLIYTRITYTRNLIIYRDIPDALEQMKIIEAANTIGQYDVYIVRLKTMIAEVQQKQ